MDYVVLWTGLALSLGFNAYFCFILSKKRPQLTRDAQALLHDLTKGKTVLEIKVLDPAGLFYRSPRG